LTLPPHEPNVIATANTNKAVKARVALKPLPGSTTLPLFYRVPLI
jgi:hypothetical protein